MSEPEGKVAPVVPAAAEPEAPIATQVLAADDVCSPSPCSRLLARMAF